MLLWPWFGLLPMPPCEESSFGRLGILPARPGGLGRQPMPPGEESSFSGHGILPMPPGGLGFLPVPPFDDLSAPRNITTCSRKANVSRPSILPAPSSAIISLFTADNL